MTNRQVAQRLLKVSGQTFAEQAGIRLADKPGPLYRLLVLSVLLSTRISSDIAVNAAKELHNAGMSSARAMRDSDWQDRVDALGRAHYRRYDEQTATALGNAADLLIRDYHGDLRRLRDQATGRPEEITRLLQRFPRLGPVGADIFCREAQLVWPELRPHLDKKALSGAEKLGLPTEPRQLARLVDPDQLAALAAALVRTSLKPSLAEKVST